MASYDTSSEYDGDSDSGSELEQFPFTDCEWEGDSDSGSELEQFPLTDCEGCEWEGDSDSGSELEQFPLIDSEWEQDSDSGSELEQFPLTDCEGCEWEEEEDYVPGKDPELDAFLDNLYKYTIPERRTEDESFESPPQESAVKVAVDFEGPSQMRPEVAALSGEWIIWKGVYDGEKTETTSQMRPEVTALSGEWITWKGVFSGEKTETTSSFSPCGDLLDDSGNCQYGGSNLPAKICSPNYMQPTKASTMKKRRKLQSQMEGRPQKHSNRTHLRKELGCNARDVMISPKRRAYKAVGKGYLKQTASSASKRRKKSRLGSRRSFAPSTCA